jgi:hypothetical protein
VNDLSERAFQLEGTGQWVKGKSADTFGPIGPWLVTRDEVLDPQNLDLWLDVDGRRYQQGTTRHMIFRGRAPGQLHLPLHEPASPATSSPRARRPASAWGRSRNRCICARETMSGSGSKGSANKANG